MNDFREYQSAFLDHQDDLMHYGVRGMKWKHQRRKPGAKAMSGGNSIDEMTDWKEKYARLRRNAMKKKIRNRLENRKKNGTVYHS